MSVEKITYNSEPLLVSPQIRRSTLTLLNGCTCICNRILRGYNVEIAWEFDWEQLSEDRYDGLSGQIIVKSPSTYFQPTTVNVDLKETGQLVTKTILTNNNSQYITFELTLIPLYLPIELSYEETFLPSEKTDTILVVDGKKMHVNSAFLSYHSDFFRNLFRLNFEKGQMNEIPIEEVSYEELGLLLSSFHLKPVFPNDETVEKILEMVDRFDTPTVIGIVEYHLMHNSKIEKETMIRLAEKYGMSKLLEKMIRETSSKINENIVHHFTQSNYSSFVQPSTLTLCQGFTCCFDRMMREHDVEISWEFNWEELKKEGFDGLSGQIIVKSPNNYFQPMIVDVDLKKTVQLVTTTIPPSNYQQSITFELTLIPYYLPIEQISYEEMFLQSEKTDRILVEGPMDENPIEEVSYEDLGLLLSSFHLKPVFPNDKTVPKLLEMADRFDTPSVIGIVEYHLIHNSRIENEKMMWMADNYGMSKLLQKTIRQMSSIEKAKALKASPEYKELSKGTKAKVLDRLMELI
uniref:BTB domain-containing protein n=1 Tax=Caenorhabditis tropicalis TaxID=1561998 RepID=A0A1I7U8P5_9PELO